MAKNYAKIRSCTCRMTDDLYNKFVFKAKSDGYTIQQAMASLVLEYVKGTFDKEVG